MGEFEYTGFRGTDRRVSMPGTGVDGVFHAAGHEVSTPLRCSLLTDVVKPFLVRPGSLECDVFLRQACEECAGQALHKLAR